MTELATAFTGYLRQTVNDTRNGWDRFWFTPADPTGLAVVRWGVTFFLLYAYLGLLPATLDWMGPHAWVDSQAVAELRGGPDAELGRWSVWFWITTPTWFWLGHALFLGSLGCLALGFWPRTACVIAWIGHVSFSQRGLVCLDGSDAVAAFVLLYLIICPGGGVSLRRRETPASSVAANLALRCIQVHLCVVYACSGLSKLQGPMWWSGTAIYYSSMLPEYWPACFDFRWLAVSDLACQAMSNVGTAATLGYEIGFPFLIWNRALRPWLFAVGFLLHGAIGLVLGLEVFSAIMVVACLTFVDGATLRWFCSCILPRPRLREAPPILQLARPAGTAQRRAA